MNNQHNLEHSFSFNITQEQAEAEQIKTQDFSHSIIQQSDFDVYTCQLTVMFCDLVGSTALSEQLALCAYWNILQQYQERCSFIIQNCEGYISQPLGDGLLIYFGFPTLQQDDATRAIQAGLDVLLAIEQLNVFFKEWEINLAVRVGIATGEVLMAQVRSGDKSEWLAIGVIPNIAARLQSLAPSNSVVFCPTTHQLVRECFDCQFLGAKSLKGISQPMEVYQVSR